MVILSKSKRKCHNIPIQLLIEQTLIPNEASLPRRRDESNIPIRRAMDRELMLIPMFAMVCLTFVVGATMRFRREKVVKEGFNWRYYKTFEGEMPPRESLQADLHFINLFEVPVLFYAACLTTMTLDSVDQIGLALAGLFVIGRFVHAQITLTHNKMLIRSRVYVLTSLILFVFWCWIFATSFVV
jgi:hypothetical protein